jgi:pimeloyl-ACP methyl ester carboxylesterase
VLPAISSYLDERTRFRERWIGALRKLDLPAHVLWGRRDPVAIPAIAEALAETIPGARLTWLDELGHYPMLENPTRWAENVLSFFH